MRKAIRFAGLASSAFLTLIYLVSCLTPYIPPQRFPPITLLSLAYLPIVLIYLLQVIAWLFIRKKIALLLIVLFFAGYKNFTATVAFNLAQPTWKQAKDTSTLRVMSWNVNYLGNPIIAYDTLGNLRRKMIEYIKKEDPDVLCLQDFSSIVEGTAKGIFYKNLETIFIEGHYISQHYAYVYSHKGENYHDKVGVIIFSKKPITGSGSFAIDTGKLGEQSGYIDLDLQGKTLRIFTAHLTSMALWPNQVDEAGLDYLKGDGTKQKTSAIVSKLLHFGKLHAAEAKTIKNEMNKSPYPVLLAADMNAVPSSYVYHTLKKGLTDAFLEKDFGIGGTYNMVFPKIRIDVLLHSKEIEIVQYTRPAVKLSDHYPVIADIRWK